MEEVLKVLKKQLDESHYSTQAKKCLDEMVSIQLNNFKGAEQQKSEVEIQSFSKKDLVRLVLNENPDNMDSSKVNKFINEKKLNVLLDKIVADAGDAFNPVGKRPVVEANGASGGRGNERLFKLAVKDIVSTEEADESHDDVSVITYEKTKAKLSLFSKVVLINGEIENKSPRGLLMLLFIIFVFVLYFLLTLIAGLLLGFTSENLSLWQLILFTTWFFILYRTWHDFFLPMYRLPFDRIIKAPELFIALGEMSGELEMYRDETTFSKTRITKYTSVCPICSANIELASGKPEQKLPLVGRCIEAPHAHVYSFDRMTRKGFFIGVGDYTN